MVENSDRKAPIGIFDSGVGGLTVLKEVVNILPHESVIYYADSANCPYGIKSRSEIIKLSEQIADFLIGKNCKLIVVACNTATGMAIDYLRKKYRIPFVGMEPAVKPAALNTGTGSIGILATKGTYSGRHYKETSGRFATDKKVIVRIGSGLVELAERGETYSPEVRKLLKKYILPMLDANVDHIVLGCTHYPLFMPVIEEITGGKVKILDPAAAVARQTYKLLEQNGLLSPTQNPECTFFTTGDLKILKKTTGKFLKMNAKFYRL
ncbi:MAG: glutamate racemase [Bacteroidetes bacterium]|nr:glutamate racemase [Bacteroidota bacterium]